MEPTVRFIYRCIHGYAIIKYDTQHLVLKIYNNLVTKIYIRKDPKKLIY